jgi:hypothetical protein
MPTSPRWNTDGERIGSHEDLEGLSNEELWQTTDDAKEE